jgi:hypothetical protein
MFKNLIIYNIIFTFIKHIMYIEHNFQSILHLNKLKFDIHLDESNKMNVIFFN